jgi:DNA-binding MarR family transcriptional regulator
MPEEIIFRRRNRIKNDVVITSKVLLYGYAYVSDAAKITYQVIDGFDWEDKATKASKGCAWPASETLANIRKTTVRTIERHIKELEKAGLLTRIRRRNKSSILYIEDISQKEINQYIAEYTERLKDRDQSGGEQASETLSTTDYPETPTQSRNDKNVGSGEASETTKMSVAYKKKENELKENKLNVNEDFKKAELKRQGQTSSIGDILKTYQLPPPKRVTQSERRLKRDSVAQQLAQDLNDTKSLGCYRVIAGKIPQHVVFQVLSSVKDVAASGKIHKSRGALFVEIIKRYAGEHRIDLGFQAPEVDQEVKGRSPKAVPP